jgi:hypothetical protein
VAGLLVAAALYFDLPTERAAQGLLFLLCVALTATMLYRTFHLWQRLRQIL